MYVAKRIIHIFGCKVTHFFLYIQKFGLIIKLNMCFFLFCGHIWHKTASPPIALYVKDAIDGGVCDTFYFFLRNPIGFCQTVAD